MVVIMHGVYNAINLIRTINHFSLQNEQLQLQNLNCRKLSLCLLRCVGKYFLISVACAGEQIIDGETATTSNYRTSFVVNILLCDRRNDFIA